MSTPRPPVSRPAVATAAVGIVCLVAGAIWPWLTNPVGVIGDQPSVWLLWASVAVAAAVLVTVLANTRPRWSLILVGVLVVMAIATRATADPSWMCWDGLDDEGNMIGGCEDDAWTPAPIVYAVGIALTAVAAILHARRRPR